MKLGFLGLGKMGKNMVIRLLENGVEVVAWNRSPQPRQEVSEKGGLTVELPEEVVFKLTTPRTIWLMLPAGDVTDQIISALLPHLSEGDLLIDGANSFYKDTLRRAELLSENGISYMDVGVSGGPSGARNGACLMIGGKNTDFSKMAPLFQLMASPDAYAHLGPVGAGHFAKMVHNGIEYGMMQSIAEGAAVLQKSAFDYDLGKVFRLYNNRSVIESRLVGWTEEAFVEDPELDAISSKINHTGEGEWTIKTAHELEVAVPIIEKSFGVRVESSETTNSFRDKVVSALRGKFGGHAVKV